jgi:hypothetical protein
VLCVEVCAVNERDARLRSCGFESAALVCGGLGLNAQPPFGIVANGLPGLAGNDAVVPRHDVAD